MPDHPDHEEGHDGGSLYPEGLEDALRRAIDAEKGNGEAVEPTPENEEEAREDSP